MKVSKNVKSGSLVKIRGDKIVCTSKRPIGVFTAEKEEERVIRKLDGSITTVVTHIPRGIMLSGICSVASTKKALTSKEETIIALLYLFCCIY